MVGAACPDLVYPNYEDWGFVKVQLDKRSFDTARASLAKVDDPLLRAMLWQSLWDGVRDGKLPLNDFIATALNNAPQEKDYTLLGDVLGKVDSAKRYLDASIRTAPTRQAATRQLEDMAWSAPSKRTAPTDNFQRRWFGTYLAVASSPGARPPGRPPRRQAEGRRPEDQPGPALVHHQPPEPLRLPGRRRPGRGRAGARQVRQRPGRGAGRDRGASGSEAVKTEWLGQDPGPEDQAAVLEACAPRWAACTRPAERAQRTERRTAPGHAGPGRQERRPGVHARLRTGNNC
jgi:hypothetical protein